MEENNHCQPSKPWSEGYIYLIDYGNGETFKIGRTKYEPEKRLKELSGGVVIMPMHLVMAAKIDTSHAYIENLLHMKYDINHVAGEWFTLDFMDVVEIAQILQLLSGYRLKLYDRWFDVLVPDDWQEYIDNYGIHAHYPAFERKEHINQDYHVDLSEIPF